MVPQFLPKSLTDLATIGRDKTAGHETIVVIFILALITIAGEIHSDAAFRCGEVSSAAAPDPPPQASRMGSKAAVARHDGRSPCRGWNIPRNVN
jgi:hypothetical protein